MNTEKTMSFMESACFAWNEPYALKFSVTAVCSHVACMQAKSLPLGLSSLKQRWAQQQLELPSWKLSGKPTWPRTRDPAA